MYGKWETDGKQKNTAEHGQLQNELIYAVPSFVTFYKFKCSFKKTKNIVAYPDCLTNSLFVFYTRHI